jgi:CMP/dCMP kinase
MTEAHEHRRPGPAASDHARLVVALDGPGSSGKSSVGAAAALALGYRFCDTGLLYRAATWLALERGVALDDPEALVPLVTGIELAPDEYGRLDRVLVGSRDVTAEVHTARVDDRVSEVSRVPELRSALLERQRSLAEEGRIIMAGRDIGTVVLPDADLKIYLDASVEERARRRAEERGLGPGGPEGRFILAQLRHRDGIDSSRAVAPLRIASDAIVLRTDGNTFEDTVQQVIATIRAAEGARTAGSGARS